MNKLKIREVSKVIKGQATTDGDGVVLTRIIGTQQLDMLDPFLLLDAFGSDKPLDYIGGFPNHPHRGFETVTYMLAGKMRHKDSAGNEGVIEKDGIQWMTAGKGIIHSEMPEQDKGLLSGLQLWVNLPRSKKMTEPRYQEYSGDEIAVDDHNGYTIKVLAGITKNGTKGKINNPDIDPIYWDVNMQPQSQLQEFVGKNHNTFIYVLKGAIKIGLHETQIDIGQLAVLSFGDTINIKSTDSSSRFVVVAGIPLNEPVARGGPFVMNTTDEIHQAFNDYKTGQLV
jgi:hypothetical protein